MPGKMWLNPVDKLPFYSHDRRFKHINILEQFLKSPHMVAQVKFEGQTVETTSNGLKCAIARRYERYKDIQVAVKDGECYLLKMRRTDERRNVSEEALAGRPVAPPATPGREGQHSAGRKVPQDE